MDENPQDVNTEISLDDFNADEQQPAKVDPSPTPKDEPKAPEEKTEAKDTEAEKTDDTATPPDVPTKDESEAPADTVEAEDKPSKADERKTQLNTEIRDLVAQRNALKAEVEMTNAEVYQPATEDELSDVTNPETGQPYTKLEAKVEALRQSSEMEKYNTQVAEAQLTIGHESNRVLTDFPIFNPESDSYDKELAEEAATHLDANLIRDPNTNQVIGTNPGFSPYAYYQILARAAGLSEVKGQLKAQADTETQLANVDANSNVAPPKVKEDPLLELWKSDD